MLLHFIGKGSPITPLTAKENEEFSKMKDAAIMDDKARAKAERLEALRQKIKAVARMQRIFSNLR